VPVGALAIQLRCEARLDEHTLARAAEGFVNQEEIVELAEPGKDLALYSRRRLTRVR
jgi:hypothetical protein